MFLHAQFLQLQAIQALEPAFLVPALASRLFVIRRAFVADVLVHVLIALVLQL